MLIDVLQEINEGRSEKGRGSKAGREKFASKKGTKGSSVKARKSRVKVYDSIKDALNSAAPYGTIFSTKSADRLYVISKPTWGDKSRAGGNTRIAKGFTPGAATPSASWPSIKSHAVRTMLKHGGSKAKRLTQKYGPGRERPEEKRYAGKKSTRKKPVKEAHCPVKGKLAELLPLLNLIKRVLMKEAMSTALVPLARGGAAGATRGGATTRLLPRTKPGDPSTPIARRAPGQNPLVVRPQGGAVATKDPGRSGARAVEPWIRRLPSVTAPGEGGTGGTGGATGPEGPEGSKGVKKDPGREDPREPAWRKRQYWKSVGRRPLAGVRAILRRGPRHTTV